MYEEWVIDATMYNNDGLLCFVPIENRVTDKETLVLGMNILSDVEHFEQGKIIGIVHMDGQKAVDRFCDEHSKLLKSLKEKIYALPTQD